MKLFLDIEKGRTFYIKSEFGTAAFLKTRNNKAICLWSKNGTYLKGMEPAFLEDDICFEDINDIK
jgi:hypothetical protein